MKIGKVKSAGYAAATTGGVSFMLGLEVSEKRFGSIEKEEAFALSFVYPVEEGEGVKMTVCTETIHEDGTKSFWGLDEDEPENELTKSEKQTILVQCEEMGIVETAKHVVQKYKNLQKEWFDEKYDVPQVTWNESTTLEDIVQHTEKQNRLRSERENLQNQMKELENFDFEKMKTKG